MIHHMHLNDDSFELVKSGKKSIEIRLFDEKRKKIKTGDTIIFSKVGDENQKVSAKVLELYYFPSFEELFSTFPKTKFGHDKKLSLEEQIEMQRKIYSEDEEKKYGVLGINIKLLDKLPEEGFSAASSNQ
ncbi:MAG: ASCH domain-containing protein [Candidatus Micrarchaeia archaeon]